MNLLLANELIGSAAVLIIYIYLRKTTIANALRQE